MQSRNLSDAASQHDGFVVATPLLVDSYFISTKITGQIGAAKFIAERRATNWGGQHNVKRGSNMIRFAIINVFPGLDRIRNTQIGNAESGQPRLGFGAGTGCAFIADFTAHTGGRSRKR